MVKLSIFVILSCSLLVIGNGESPFEDSKTIRPPFRVYLHAIFGGPNASSYEVGRASITSTSPTNFGQFKVTDDLLTTGPDPNSQNLGRNEGTFIYSGLNETSISVVLNFVFSAGQYAGSSLTLVGRRLLLGQNQEIPIVGGTGVFRLARGYTISSFYSFDPATSTYIFVNDVYIVGLPV